METIISKPRWVYIVILSAITIFCCVIAVLFSLIIIYKSFNIFLVILIVMNVMGIESCIKKIIQGLKRYTFYEDKVIIFDILKRKEYTIYYSDLTNILIGYTQFSRFSSCKLLGIETNIKMGISILDFSHTSLDEVIKYLYKNKITSKYLYYP